MPPPLKTVARVVAALSTTASHAGQRIPHSRPPARKPPKEMSGTLAALKSGTPSASLRPSIAASTTRRPVGGNALQRTQSMPSMSATSSMSASRTAAHGHRDTASSQSLPPLPAVTRPGPQSNSDLQQALTQRNGETNKPSSIGKDEDAQLQAALANSRAEAFLQPATREDEDAQLRKALLHSRADVFMPASPSHDPEEAQLQQALALSRAEVFMPPANAQEEAAQLTQALARSEADAPASASHDAEDAKLQQALAESRADAFMPPSNADEEQAQLRHAIAQSQAETPEHAHEPHPPQHSAPMPVDPFAASQEAQMKIQIAMKQADVLKAFGEAMKEITKG